MQSSPAGDNKTKNSFKKPRISTSQLTHQTVAIETSTDSLFADHIQNTEMGSEDGPMQSCAYGQDNGLSCQPNYDTEANGSSSFMEQHENGSEQLNTGQLLEDLVKQMTYSSQKQTGDTTQTGIQNFLPTNFVQSQLYLYDPGSSSNIIQQSNELPNTSNSIVVGNGMIFNPSANFSPDVSQQNSVANRIQLPQQQIKVEYPERYPENQPIQILETQKIDDVPKILQKTNNKCDKSVCLEKTTRINMLIKQNAVLMQRNECLIKKNNKLLEKLNILEVLQDNNAEVEPEMTADEKLFKNGELDTVGFHWRCGKM